MNDGYKGMKHLFVDNFAGGGGASTGIEMAIGRSVDIAINHDPDAIAMHRANHTATKHYCEDVWEVDPVEACAGNPVALAWFSPDCKHFSRAKGGKPVDKHIRGLAWVAVKWAYKVRPKVLMLENVPEIRTWGPLGDDGKPIKERAGETFKGFVLALTTGIPETHPAYQEMCDALAIDPGSEDALRLRRGLGYKLEYRILKSCDYGAPTTRTRFYMIARCDGRPIVFPEATHAPKNSAAVKSGLKLPYHTAAECIDWSIPAQSIFDREKPLAENTMRRIARGIQKFVVDNPEPFIINYKFENEPQSAEDPLTTVTAVNNHYLVAPTLVPIGYGERDGQAPRVNNQDGQPMDAPLSTITSGGGHHAEVQAFLVKYFSGGVAKSVNEPLDTITTKDRFGLVTIHGEEYIITDIRMRMLQPRELFKAQGFPEDYIIDHDADGRPYGKAKQVARCGNAVTPPVPAALVRANLPEECQRQEGEAV